MACLRSGVSTLRFEGTVRAVHRAGPDRGACGFHEDRRLPPKHLRDSERVKAMLQFIMDNYGEAIDTAAIARSASVSESECLRCFRSTIGTTPIRYLREYRIEQAANRLANSRASIADIASACGFQDISYFTKTFREMKGSTPKEYYRLHNQSKRIITRLSIFSKWTYFLLGYYCTLKCVLPFLQ